jgi:hypothetical protein
LFHAFETNFRQISSSVDYARDLLKNLIEEQPAHFIVDGLDEISEVDRSSLLKSLLQLRKDSVNFKLLISSRGEQDIARLLKPDVQIIRVHFGNGRDIQSYVNKRTDEWLSRLQLDEEMTLEIRSLVKPIGRNSKGKHST